MIDSERATSLSIRASGLKPASAWDDLTEEEIEFYNKSLAFHEKASASGKTVVYPTELPAFGKITKVWPKD